jgi:4-hydroxy-tetrahydrodipicolinate synthase
MFKGSFTALITPFRDGEVDEECFRALVERQIAEGTHGLIPCGTTGESPTLNHEEHRRVTEICIEATRGRVPVIAGAGSNSTREAIELTCHAREAGAAAALIVTPYYNKPTQEGLYRHFRAIHDAADLPIFIYNIPGRCVVDMSLETLRRLAGLPNIVGLKDATGDLDRPLETRIEVGPEFIQFSGEDGTALAFLVQGGHGCISVTANLAPRACAEMHEAWQAGEFARAMAIQERLMPLHKALFAETSPVPVKHAASLLGLCRDEVRLPLCGAAETTRQRLRSALERTGLLN